MDDARNNELDAIAEHAALLTDAPAALIAIAEEGRLVLEGRAGVLLTDVPASGTGPFAHGAREPIVAEDVRRAPELLDHPLLQAWPGARFFALAPIADHHGAILGALAVLDRRARPLLGPQRDQLRLLAQSAAALIELRRRLKLLARVVEALPEPLFAFDLAGRVVFANSHAARAIGLPPARLIGQTVRALPPGARTVIVKM